MEKDKRDKLLGTIADEAIKEEIREQCPVARRRLTDHPDPKVPWPWDNKHLTDRFIQESIRCEES